MLRNRAFILLSLTIFLGYTHVGLLGATLPLYITANGGSPFVAGLVLAGFSIMSFGLRPLVGYSVDRWSTPQILTMGTVLLGACSAAFLLPSMVVLAIANTVRGLGWAALNTAGYTAVGLVSPPNRRAETSSYYNVAISVATAASPALALWLIAPPFKSFPAVFALGAIAAFLAAAAGHSIHPPSAPNRPAASRPGPPGLRLGAFIDRGVLLASVLLLALTVTNGAAISFLPLYARDLGIENPGIYFILSGAVSILFRVAFGRYLDRGSRGAWILAAFSLLAVGMLVLRSAPDLTILVAGGMVYSLGNSLASTILLALALDLADPHRPGAAMATYSASYQIGHALGAPAAGALIQLAGFGGMYLGATACAVLGIGLTVANWGTLARRSSIVPAVATSG